MKNARNRNLVTDLISTLCPRDRCENPPIATVKVSCGNGDSRVAARARVCCGHYRVLGARTDGIRAGKARREVGLDGTRRNEAPVRDSWPSRRAHSTDGRTTIYGWQQATTTTTAATGVDSTSEGWPRRTKKIEKCFPDVPCAAAEQYSHFVKGACIRENATESAAPAVTR